MTPPNLFFVDGTLSDPHAAVLAVASSEDLEAVARAWPYIFGTGTHPELCNLLMHIDAFYYAKDAGLPLADAQEIFSYWAATGHCPYANPAVRDAVRRVVWFSQRRCHWDPIPDFDEAMIYDTLFLLTEWAQIEVAEDTGDVCVAPFVAVQDDAGAPSRLRRWWETVRRWVTGVDNGTWNW